MNKRSVIYRHGWGFPTLIMAIYILVTGLTSVHQQRPVVTEPSEYGWGMATASLTVLIGMLTAFLWGRDCSKKE